MSRGGHTLKGQASIQIKGTFYTDYRSVLILLYYPLIDKGAYLLYETLLALSEHNENYTLESLCLFSGLKEKKFEEARQILEEFQLLQTYSDPIRKVYRFEIYPPKKANDFLRDNTFGRLLLEVLGSAKYEQLNRMFQKKEEASTQGMVNISKQFDPSRLLAWNEDKEAMLASILPRKEEQRVQYAFDFDTLLEGMRRIFPPRLRTTQNLQTIATLANVYGIDAKEMKIYLQRSVDPFTHEFSPETLENQLQRATPKIKPTQDKYAMPPIHFLQMKQAGPIAQADQKLLKDLCVAYEFPNEVVNLLIEYVLDNTNQNLQRSYVEKVASTWSRLKIDSKEKALEQIHKQKTHRSYKTSRSSRQSELPEWYQNQQATPLQESTKAELEKRLQRLQKKTSS